MICGECKRFSECFTESNNLIGVKPEEVDEKTVDEAMNIPACDKALEVFSR